MIVGSYRMGREKATVIGSVGYAGWQQGLVKVIDGKGGWIKGIVAPVGAEG
jgi:hypothetical protein